MTLRIGYYPGCSGAGTSTEYEQSTRAVLRKLGVELHEVPDWSCCGSTPAHTVSHTLSAALSARNLELAGRAGFDLVATPCPSCLANLRTAGHKMENADFRAEVSRLVGADCADMADARSTVEVLARMVGPKAVAQRVTRPLKGLKVVCYYGCLMTRPPEVMDFDDPENPTAMDELLAACGAEVLPFAYKVECCGAAAGTVRGDITAELSGRILDAAVAAGADAVVAACPLCQMNLDLRRGQINKARGTVHDLPVFYFTQLMGLALGLSSSDLGIKKLAVDPNPVLRRAFAAPKEDAAGKKSKEGRECA